MPRINNLIIFKLSPKKIAHPEFQVSRGKDDKFYFSLTAANGLVILSSQGYSTKVA